MLVHVRQIKNEQGVKYLVEKGVSLYTPFTTHYELEDDFWKELEKSSSQLFIDMLVEAKIQGVLPINSKLPYPPIKRKL